MEQIKSIHRSIEVIYIRGVSDYDIGMVRIFVLVYETRSVTEAAQQLFITQPSVSYALGKLRNRFGDRLFVRRQQRLVPTRLADELYPRLRELLEGMDGVMGQAAGFDPATSTRTFRLHMTDVGITGLLPRLLRRLAAEAPGIAVEVESLNLPVAADALRLGRADAVVCTPLLDGPDLARELLFTQPYVGVCGPRHPRIGDRPTVQEFEAELHVGVAAETGHQAVDLRIRELGVKRRMAVRLPSFAGLAGVLEQTELLSFAPESYAQRFVAHGQLRVFELPFAVPVSEVALYTVRRQLPSPEADWFRGLVADALRTPPADPRQS